ncbi:hypothetical protein KJ632_00660 [Patescibacteria group bacterium]|nr:hypothetical protein [Patescibacteria group bacterium]
MPIKLKQFAYVGFGMMLGLAIFAVQFLHGSVAFGEEGLSGYEQMESSLQDFGQKSNWRKVFGDLKEATSPNIYYLIMGKLKEVGHDKAIEVIAENYGYTKDRAERIVDGSLLEILNDPEEKNVITSEEAFRKQATIAADYEYLKEIFDLEQELDIMVSPQEIFANGDLEDSGFDLVYDLTVIEHILFLNDMDVPQLAVSANSLSSPYVAELDSPLLAPVDTPAFEDEQGEGSGSDENIDEDGEKDDGGVEADELDEDVCPTEKTPLQTATNALRAKAGAGPAPRTQGDPKTYNQTDATAQAVADKLEKLLAPTTPQEFLETYCPGSETGASASAGVDVGSATGVPIIDSAGLGASAGYDSPLGISMNVSVCMQIEMIKKTVSSYNAGDSCIQCEVEATNEKLKKLLNHTLLPNKTVGNMFESAKCAGPMEETPIAMNIVLNAVPIPSPPNDDLIFGKNIVEEWTKFANKTGWSKTALSSLPGDIVAFDTIEESLSQAQQLEDSFSQNAFLVVEAEKAAEKAENMMSLAEIIRPKIQKATEFFENYQAIYSDQLLPVCQGVLSKGNTKQ